jgi:acetylornithine deacetylase/succinyl-diaminopimelate desuccinylase-like protein
LNRQDAKKARDRQEDYRGVLSSTFYAYLAALGLLGVLAILIFQRKPYHPTMPNPTHAFLDNDHPAAIARLCNLLKIPSISTNPAFAKEARRGAEWIEHFVKQLGFTTRLIERGGGHPVLLAHAPNQIVRDASKPCVLFYGHYDVQPPDPVEKWSSPPFEPVIRESMSEGDGPAIYARGACDDKGQVMCFLEALHAYRQTGDGKLPCPVTLLIEGEEESRPRCLPIVLDEFREQLNADVAVVSDTAMHDVDTIAITYGLRGLAYFDVKLHGPSRDLHSGVYGGTLPNPATILVKTLAKLWDDNHQIAIPGFYDDVASLRDDERHSWQQLGFDDVQFTGEVGSTPFGEAGYTTLERRWARPTCDINGLFGGYMDAGAKTVIASFAGAKVSFRLPGDMDPHKVQQQFRAWLLAQDVKGCRWEIEELGAAHPVLVSRDSPFVAAAQRAIEATSGKPAALVRDGATIPVIADLKNALGIDALLVGFGLNADNLHSPDEHFSTRRLLLGAKTHAALLEEIGRM